MDQRCPLFLFLGWPIPAISTPASAIGYLFYIFNGAKIVYMQLNSEYVFAVMMITIDK